MLYSGPITRLALVAAALVACQAALAGCEFDRTGVGQADPGGADAAGARADASGPTADGAPGPDGSMPLCKDDDGDGFKFPIVPGSDCGVLDCNDSDEFAHPDQDGAFTTPTSVGDFDYNCDGVETKLADTRAGDDCNRPPFGSCEGTGWLGGVPGCGETGVYHRCDSDIFSCFEAEQTEFAMPCN